MEIKCTVEEFKKLFNNTKIKTDGTKISKDIVPSLNESAKQLGYKPIL